MRNRAIFKCNAPQAKQERDKGRAKGRNTPKEREQERTTCTQWTPPPPQRESHNGSSCTLKTQIYLKFCPFWSPKFPRKHQSTPKIHLLLTRLGIFCPDDRQGIGWRVLDVCPDMGSAEHKRGTPPPICGATSALHPHNFSHHKNRKKFAQEDTIFRTENIEKSQPALGWKKFRKKFAGKCFGGKGKPPILRRGGEVLKYERLVYVCKDSGIISKCKRIVVL